MRGWGVGGRAWTGVCDSLTRFAIPDGVKTARSAPKHAIRQKIDVNDILASIGEAIVRY
jgi:hypothetical protein